MIVVRFPFWFRKKKEGGKGRRNTDFVIMLALHIRYFLFNLFPVLSLSLSQKGKRIISLFIISIISCYYLTCFNPPREVFYFVFYFFISPQIFSYLFIPPHPPRTMGERKVNFNKLCCWAEPATKISLSEQHSPPPSYLTRT